MQKNYHSTRQSNKPRRTGGAATPIPKKPPQMFDAPAALAILWVVTTPPAAPANTPFGVMVHAHKFAAIARELLRSGMLQKTRVRKGRHWEDAYKLAPLEEPLDPGHCKIVRQIADYMLEHPDDSIVAHLRAVSGLLTKLLGGIRHRSSAGRMLYAEQFLEPSRC